LSVWKAKLVSKLIEVVDRMDPNNSLKTIVFAYRY